MNLKVYLYIAVMAIVTYIIRMVPLVLIRKKIENKFLQSFLYYVPFVTLAVMTFPAVLGATDSLWSALAGFIVAVILALLNQSLFTVSISACLMVFVVEMFI